MADSMNQHKRLAMGEKVTGYAKGGSVKAPPPKAEAKPKGMSNYARKVAKRGSQ